MTAEMHLKSASLPKWAAPWQYLYPETSGSWPVVPSRNDSPFVIGCCSNGRLIDRFTGAAELRWVVMASPAAQRKQWWRPQSDFSCSLLRAHVVAERYSCTPNLPTSYGLLSEPCSALVVSPRIVYTPGIYLLHWIHFVDKNTLDYSSNRRR